MCGIVGLFLKDDRLSADLGTMLSPMLEALSDRGPDSTGFAIYGESVGGNVKVTLYSSAGAEYLKSTAARTGIALSIRIDLAIRHNHAILALPSAAADKVVEWLGQNELAIRITGIGERIEIYKDVGLPAEVIRHVDLKSMGGTHAIGHTRMATESAVTPSGAHPFSTGRDQCLVHNGSLSNHNSLRRMLSHDGFTFDTENDTEVAAAYLSWRMRQGMNLGVALEASLTDLDGFFTFVVGTESGFGVLRDPIACKPAVMAETESYVAFGTEYRALANLPGIAKARVWEPEPSQVYFWERGQ